MPKKKSNIVEFFGLDNLETEYHNIPLEKLWLEQLARHSKSTLDKLLEADVFKAGVDEENKPYWYLPLEKRYGLTVKETRNQADTSEFMPFLHALAQELLEVGHSNEEVMNTILTPSEWKKLTAEQAKRASRVYSLAIKAQDRSVGLATLVFTRICPNWTNEDTLALADGLFTEIVDFAQKEEQGWKSEESEDVGEQSSPQSITVEDSSKTIVAG